MVISCSVHRVKPVLCAASLSVSVASVSLGFGLVPVLMIATLERFSRAMFHLQKRGATVKIRCCVGAKKDVRKRRRAAAGLPPTGRFFPAVQDSFRLFGTLARVLEQGAERIRRQSAGTGGLSRARPRSCATNHASGSAACAATAPSSARRRSRNRRSGSSRVNSSARR